MAGLRCRFQASSIPECMVAAVIFLTVFLAGMEIMSRLSISMRLQQPSPVVMMTVRRYHGQYADGKQLPGEQTFMEEQMEVSISVQPYLPGIQQLKITVAPLQRTNAFTFYYLIAEYDEEN